MRLATFFNRLMPSPLRPVECATRRYLQWSNYIVQGGPFRGLRYIHEAHCSQLAPKIAGTYEREIRPALEQMVATKPDAFINIGAAEGYYTIGAAIAGWSPRLVAFESDSAAREALRQLAALNGIADERIDLRGACSPRELESLLGSCERPSVIMDVEGYEVFLLDPLRVPSLRKATILLEHHDFHLPGLCDEIIARMRTTHEIEAVAQSPRTAGELVCSDPLVRAFPAGIRRRVLNEMRPFDHHGWLFLTPRV